MLKGKMPSLEGMKLGEGKISEMLMGLFETTDPKKLDRIKKNIQALRQSGKLENLAINLQTSFESGFKEDLEEAGVSGDAQKPFLQRVRQLWKKEGMSAKAEAILKSPELAEWNAFITKIENLPKLKKVLESAEPQPRWQAMLKGFASKIPGLDKHIGSSFGPILSAMGLGFLVKKNKSKKIANVGAKVAGKAGKKKPGTKEGEKKPEGPKETLADLPVAWVPKGRTLIMGDSNLDGNRKLKFKKTDTLDAKGGMQATWAIPRIKRMGEKINEYDNLVVGFGGNDLGAVGPAEILSRYRRIVEQVRKMNKKNGGKHRTKIYLVTTPPLGTNKKWLCGKWNSDMEGTCKKRIKLNKMIREAKTKNTIDFDEVIDMGATVKNGGVASNENPAQMAKGLNRKGDPVHVKGGEYAKRIRFAMYLSEKKEKRKGSQNVA